MKNDRFVVSALVDFPDDCGNIVFTRSLVENLIERLQSVGITRVYWNFYQAGMWEFFGAGSEATRETLGNLGALGRGGPRRPRAAPTAPSTSVPACWSRSGSGSTAWGWGDNRRERNADPMRETTGAVKAMEEQ